MIERIVYGSAGLVLGGSLGAASGAVTMAIGAKVFDDTHYLGFNVGQAMAAGALGGSILAGGMGLLQCLLVPTPRNLDDVTPSTSLSLTASIVPATWAGSLLGAAILGAAGHDRMAVDKLFASAVMGSLVIGAGIAAVTVPALMAFAILHGSQEPTLTPPQS